MIKQHSYSSSTKHLNNRVLIIILTRKLALHDYSQFPLYASLITRKFTQQLRIPNVISLSFNCGFSGYIHIKQIEIKADRNKSLNPQVGVSKSCH